eukprot:TRINITY_DN18424_c0_g1_i3.p1 TRINITY_DN18424_c0_g1~~TRINITY_DN18424_c0_g1_i3.p1  ORF type:complete len:288 (+),score=59.20 TRINITY_DN18424_c0_g1_i3:82-945(+)
MAYMEKKEVGMVKFWQIGLRDSWVTTRYGSLGGEGVSRTREFEDQQDAVQHLVEAVISKKDLGYELKNKKRKLEVLKESSKNAKKEQSNAKNEKKMKSEIYPPKSSPNNNQRRKKRGLSGAAAPDSTKPLGFVDPESCLYGDLYRNKYGTPFDAMLVKKYDTSDCYYIMQLIENKQYNEYKVYFRWGRIGSAGQCQVLHPQNLKDALELFKDKFWEKTSCEWDDRERSRYRPDMYRWVKPPLADSLVLRVQDQDPEQSSNEADEHKSDEGNEGPGDVAEGSHYRTVH